MSYASPRIAVPLCVLIFADVTAMRTFSISSMRISRPVEASRKCFDITSPVGKVSMVLASDRCLSLSDASLVAAEPVLAMPPVPVVCRAAFFIGTAIEVKLRFEACNLSRAT